MVVPLARRVVETGSSAVALLKVLDAATHARIDQVMKHCAEWASEEISKKYLKGNRPTVEQCEKQARVDARGQKVTWAMEWGLEKHQTALGCVHQKLNELWPGSFSLNQRYRYDSATGELALVSAERVRELVELKRAAELLGTLEPDVVIHSGNPRDVLAVYDFKFPCPASNEPQWRRYPEIHPYRNRTQGDVYEEAFGVSPARVAPVWGILRKKI
ncbi:hypothetical protein [Stigmatella aurantiaca]|uniref:hypothetical protein n=1 Tax=Stigmatella aurantiaca TaxID=41 RepID=UPI00030FACA4|nr:hypothetical protein [Stigmatella aurantiaca]